ncbi:hypothetical protein ACQWU4_16870 [Chryseobacterium sp. MIQD13]
MKREELKIKEVILSLIERFYFRICGVFQTTEPISCSPKPFIDISHI